jgi:uncharacterized protein
MAKAVKGNFVWYEHLTHDPKAAIAFYTEVMGWKTQPFAENTDYTMWVGSQGPLGGVMKLPEEAVKMGAPPHWMGNVIVDDVDATVAQVKSLGGKVYKEPADIPTVGRFAVIADPQGASMAVFKPFGDMEKHEVKEGEVCWNELYAADPEAALAFYEKIFGWKVLQTMDMGDMGKYRIFGQGETQYGGVMKVPQPQMPPSWCYYVETGDLDAAVARSTSKGAKIMMGPMPVPSGGRVAILTDPQGAAYALHQGAKKG